MGSKMPKGPLGGHHTAGIYADMSVDGPQIGTLVVIVDRAKNLPNRKTMGKQDPYCAARLGKEAKKTETDKRGGQTPKWDQELRFTVHESPDYYQLKISVFNDDKKTELIGESWIGLEQIIVPGGGQHDLWQNLNCKGRYAGEIRIELTYYDTRPRESQQDEQRQPASIEDSLGDNRERLSGPRQPKQMKRRPLPADPTSNSLPSSLAQEIHSSPQAPSYNTPPSTDLPEYHRSPQVDRTSGTVVDAYSSPSQRFLPTAYGTDPDSFDQNIQETEETPSSGYHQSSVHHLNSLRGSVQSSEIDQIPVEEPLFGRNPDYDTQSSFVAEPIEDHPDLIVQQGHAENIDPRLYGQPTRHSPSISNPQQNAKESNFYPVSPLSKHGSYDSGLGSRPYRRGTGDSWRSGDISPIQDHDTPPPPPVHGSGRQRQSPQMQSFRNADSQSPVPTPPPLNIRRHRDSASGSPLAHVENANPPRPAVSSDAYTTLQSVSNTVRYSPHDQSVRQAQAYSPVREFAHSMPPSLIPGYEPSVAAEESERVLRDRYSLDNQPYGVESIPQYEQHPHRYSQSNQYAVSHPVDPPEKPVHRAPAPVMRPRAISPDARRPVRKSVSPHPRSVPDEQRPSAVPFSPDSYDAFNPAIGEANSVNDLGARYETPAQAVEASRQAERQSKLGDGPIIGSNGRVIDPSDHLPSDTWAPEPEPKPTRKGPEITLKFRHSPQGPQPLSGGARRPLAETRSNIVTSRIQQPMSADNSPTSTHRVRLQKKVANYSPQHPASSPAIPTIHSNPSPRQTLPRSPASDFPSYGQSGNENYAYGASPVYNRNHSPGRNSLPPPVPEKVPIDSGYEDYRMNTLSEEMSRIDIGVGNPGRPRRARF